MISYQTADSSGSFSYELDYSKDGSSFVMNSLRIQHQGKTVFSKQRMAGIYSTEAVLIAQGLNMCEAVANHLKKP